MAEKPEPKQFTELGEVAVRAEQPPNVIGEVPLHDPFLEPDGKTVKMEKCRVCGELYAIMYHRIYKTRRAYEDLSDQLQLRLEEHHSANRSHPSIIPLRWSDPTRKRDRKQW